MRKFAIIVAGGKGLRMGTNVPKQFIPVGGRPVLMRTLDVFWDYDPAIRLILVLPTTQQAYWEGLCREYEFNVPHQVADGGVTRFHSVANGLAVISEKEATDALIAVHDGVRPFVSKEVIAGCFGHAARHRAVVPVTEVIETLRELSDGGTGKSQSVDRGKYRLVQTPQTFQGLVLKAAYALPYQPTFTDDASVVEASGVPVTLIPGNRENIKITTPFDLTIAEALLAAHQ